MPIAKLPSVKVHFVQLPGLQPPGAAADELVMIHGLATNMAFWYAGIAQSLTRYGRVTLYDLRGHGRSEMTESGYSPVRMAEDLRDLLDFLRIERVHILAHSFGGIVAVVFAHAHPERVKSLVLADVRLPPLQRKMLLKSWPLWNRWRTRLAEAGIELDENDPEAGIQILRELARLQVRHPERAKKMQQILMGGVGRLGGPRGARRFLRMLETTSAYVEMTSGTGFGRAELKRLKVPMLAIFGEQTMALASGRALQRICETCTLEVVPKAGHFFPLSKPQAFLEPAHRFLSEQIPSAPPAPRIAPLISA